jgi:hypothetical protein
MKIEGLVEARVFDAEGLGDKPFVMAMEEGRLPALLASLPVAQEAPKRHNLVFDRFPMQLLFGMFTGMPNTPNYWYQHVSSNIGSAILASICLLDLTTTPSYTEWTTTTSVAPSGVPNSVNTTYGGKRFLEDHSEPHRIFKDPDGRNAIHLVERFLWLPSQGDLADINSVGAYWCTNGDIATGDQRGGVTRHRLKDSGGSPTTLQKNTNQSLLVEYEFIFVSN